MKRGVRGVTKSLRTLSTIYVFCEDPLAKNLLEMQIGANIMKVACAKEGGKGGGLE